MSESRLERVRTACFAWFEQCHRTAVVRNVPIYARGRVIRSADYVAPIGASEERFARGIGTRGADALRVATFPTVRPVRNGSPAGRVLVSSARFLAWYLPRFYASAIPMPTVARDASAAVAYAGLVDIDRVAYGVYAVTPRDAVPTWEIDTQVKPSPTPRVHRFNGTEIALYGRLTPAEYANGRTGYVPRSMVPMGVYEAALADPMQYCPGAMSLGIATQTFLGEAGVKMPLVDVYDTYRHRWNSGPDRVAHRGATRVRRPAPMRSQRTMTETTPIGVDGQYELVTRLSRRYYCTCGPITTPTTLGATELAPTGGYTFDPAKCTCVPRGWVGHRRVTWEPTDRTKRAVAKRAGRSTVSRHGRNVGPWAMSERSLARATRNLGEQVAAVESAIRKLADGDSHTFPDGTRVVLHGVAQVFDGSRLRTYPVREWSRRYTLQVTAPTA